MMIKNLDFQITNSENNLREYCTKIMNNFEKNTTVNLNDMNVRISEVKMENNKYSYELKNSSDNLVKEMEKFLKVKEELKKSVETNIIDLKDLNKITNDNFEELKDEFHQINVKFIDLAQFIKVIKIDHIIRMLDLEKILEEAKLKKTTFKKWQSDCMEKEKIDIKVWSLLATQLIV